MKIHYILHNPHVETGIAKTWAIEKGYALSEIPAWKTDQYPQPEEIDLLIIMGGIMNVDEEHLFPWLRAEKEFIKKMVDAHKKILGICLGAQLLAEALGAKVYKSPHDEIGWFPVHFLNLSDKMPFMPENLMAFHWHSYRFDIPADCLRLAYSQATPNQMFCYNNQAIGIQFHPEVTSDIISAYISHAKVKIMPAVFTQQEDQIKQRLYHLKESNQFLKNALDWLSNI